MARRIAAAQELPVPWTLSIAVQLLPRITEMKTMDATYISVSHPGCVARL
jgi:hypothetical protein